MCAISGWGSDSDGADPNMCCIRQPPSPYLEALVLCVAVWHACLVCWTEVAEYGCLARLFGWAGERGGWVWPSGMQVMPEVVNSVTATGCLGAWFDPVHRTNGHNTLCML